MKNRHVRRAIVLGGLLALVVAGCATGPKSGEMRAGSGDVVADRQRLMKLQGASMRDISLKLRAGNVDAVAVNADTIVMTASHIPSLFPEGSTSDKSRAKPEIWQRRPEFEKAAREVQALAARLGDDARAKNADAAQADFRELAQGCDSCHTPFRVPPPRQG